MFLKVNEIFYSIQGESVHAGRPCVFVRLTGCNLRCHYCDTRYAFHEGTDYPISQILEQVASFGCRLVALTGGEPLLQEAAPQLGRHLLDSGYTLLMETNGSLDIDRMDRRCSRVMDIKCPSSGEQHRNDPGNIERLTANDQVKFVIGDEADYRFAKKILPTLPTHLPSARILFSPIIGRLPAARMARWMLDDGIQARLQIQLHKIIWPDRDRGV